MIRRPALFNAGEFTKFFLTNNSLRVKNNPLLMAALVAALIICLAQTGCLGVTGATSTNPSTGAALSLSTSTLAFGNVVDGGAGHLVLTMHNPGTGAVSITQFLFSSKDFNITGAVSLPIVINPGQTVTVNIQFVPTTPGPVNSTLAIMSDASPTPTMVRLTGMGTTGQTQIVVNPSPVPFGAVTVGSAAQQTVTLSNPGTTALSVSQVSLSGSSFSMVGTLSLPISIAPNGVGTFKVQFAPTAAGAANGTIAITSNASSTPTMVTMTGTGATTPGQPQISVTPNPVPFSNVAVGGSSNLVMKISNSGNAILTITALSASGAGYSANGFTLPISVGAGQSASFNAQFAPTVAGAANGTIAITSNASSTPTMVTLTGTGTTTAGQPQISVTPNPVPFSNVAVGGSSTLVMKISNSGNAILTITALSASGTGYSVNGFTLPISVGAGQSANFNAQFAPTVAGGSNGSISITSNATPAQTSVSMTGTGVQSGITATPSSATFANVIVGTPNSQTIKLQNAGTAGISITTAAVSGTGFSTTGLSTPLALAGGASTTFNVVYTPASPGSVTGSLILTGNMSNSPLTIPLTGSAVAPSKLLNPSATSLTFTNVPVGSNSAQNVTLTNGGNSSVTISTVTETGAGFVASGVAANQVVGAGQTATLTVTFTPSSGSTVSGNVAITSTASNSPINISLSGTGVVAVQHSVALSWTASTSSGVVGYRVYRATQSGGPYTLITNTAVVGTTFTDTTVAAGQTYFYVVTAVDGGGNESINSNEVSATVPTP